MLKELFVAYFSPTGGTKRAALYLAQYLAEQVHEIDLSSPHPAVPAFHANDTVLFAMPVFSGRIPPFAAEKLKAFQGGCTAITAVVYGNRAYDDALLELNDCAQAQGFTVQASAVLLAQHSMVPEIAAGRPDEQDRLQMADYAVRILEKLSQGGAVSVPGNRPYREWKPSAVTPLTSAACTGCKRCAQSCPTQAIPLDQPQSTDASKCMLCMRCVWVCPVQARSLPAPMQQMLAQKFAPLQGIRRENELYL